MCWWKNQANPGATWFLHQTVRTLPCRCQYIVENFQDATTLPTDLSQEVSVFVKMASVSDVSDFCASKSEFVPSEDSLSDSDNEVQTKKRKRNPMKWASNAKKANRNKGMAYITKAGKSVPARSTGPPCKCSKQCFNKVHADMKMELLVSFNKLGDKEKQDAYLCGLLTVRNIARRRPKSGTGVPREHTYLYKVRGQ